MQCTRCSHDHLPWEPCPQDAAPIQAPNESLSSLENPLSGSLPALSPDEPPNFLFDRGPRPDPFISLNTDLPANAPAPAGQGLRERSEPTHLGHEGFAQRLTEGLPLFTLKSSLDNFLPQDEPPPPAEPAEGTIPDEHEGITIEQGQ